MPIQYVAGDPMLTQASHLAIGHNAKGRREMGELETLMMRKYPAAFSSYTRRARRGRQNAGEIFLWSQAQPILIFLTIRESSMSATRLRHVQSVIVTLARDYALYSIGTLAIAPLGGSYEQAEFKQLYDFWFDNVALPVIIYDAYLPGVWAAEHV